MKNAAGKVMWVGRATVFMVGLAVMLALVLGVATKPVGATAEYFILGVTNYETAVTELVSSSLGTGPAGVAGPMLRIVNNSTDTGATGLDIQTEAGKPPMTVNSAAGKATNLNADRIDGKDGTALGVTIKTNHQLLSACAVPGTFSECAPVTVRVPAGKAYHVTALSSFAISSSSAGSVRYCPGIRSPGLPAKCFASGSTPNAISDKISYAPVDDESGAIAGEISPLPAGTYTFSTVINPTTQTNSSEFSKAHTTVMVRDVSAPGPPIQ